MPTIGEALSHGWQMHQSGHVDQAERLYRQIIAQAPGSAEAHVYLGIALFDQRRYEASEAAYREGLRLRPAFPIAWNNLGNSLRMLDRIHEADRCFEAALQQQPGYINALKNRGTLWVWAGEVERGLQWYEQALQIAPQEAELHRNLGVIYLLQGRFEEGWKEYRWRWRMPGLTRPAVDAPLWQGEQLAGRRILLYAEQGLGDAIHFIRMAAVLKQQGAETCFQCSAKLLPLLSSAPGIDRIIPEGASVGPVDYHASLIEIADHLRVDSENVPASVSYLSVDANLRDYWRMQLSELQGSANGQAERNSDVARSVRRVGICWQGNPQHHADHYRSVPLQRFAPLAEIPGVTLVSLQHGYGSEQLDHVGFGHSIVRLPDSIDRSGGAFLDTAAVMLNLELVVTTDTSTAHLAGALGVPTWLVLGKVPDWRWLMQGDTTPWYPTLRIFRQTQVGRWEDVFQRIAEALHETPKAV